MRRSLITLLAVLLLAPATGDAFPNGRAPTRELAPVFIPANAPAGYVDSNTADLSASAAAAWNTMRRCAIAQGVDLYPGPSSRRPALTAYRDLAGQWHLWSLYRSGHGALAAFPGTSNHGYGHAVDLATVQMRTWVDRHGRRFGWRKVEAFSEWWHVNYVGGFHRPDPGVSLRFPNLRRGSGGPCQSGAVREAQRRLAVPVDGEYGPGTVRAVRRFQRAHGLHVDGRVRSDTWLKLRTASRDLRPGRDPRTVQLLPGQTAPMVGVDVRAVQGLLNARFRELHRPRYQVKVTAVLDDATRVAIRRFQRLRRLPVTGRVDDRTYAVLLKRISPPSPQLVVSAAGVRLVASFEGFRSCPYRDVVGVWTIGFGHTHGVSGASRCLSRAAAERLLRRDLSLFSVQVTRLVKVRLSGGEFNAYVSFTYNVGAGALAGSTLLRELNAGRHRRACDELLRWDRAGGRRLAGLTRRRGAERALCRSGIR